MRFLWIMGVCAHAIVIVKAVLPETQTAGNSQLNYHFSDSASSSSGSISSTDSRYLREIPVPQNGPAQRISAIFRTRLHRGNQLIGNILVRPSAERAEGNAQTRLHGGSGLRLIRALCQRCRPQRQ